MNDYKFMKPSISDRQKSAMARQTVKLQERVTRLEDALIEAANIIMWMAKRDSRQDFFNPLKNIVAEIEKERKEK